MNFPLLFQSPTNTHYPSNSVRIAYCLLCVPSVEVGKHQCTTRKFNYRMAATAIQPMYLYSNIDVRSLYRWCAFIVPLVCVHCTVGVRSLYPWCNWKAITIT
jgi:hypothetical protein